MNQQALIKPAFVLSFAGFICFILFVTGTLCRPLFPVDETRYVTVAWEMISRHNWVLPHLNGEPYDHKPPLLFWSINLLWALFGIGTKQAMTVPYIYAFALIALTYRFAKKIRPDDRLFACLSVVFLAGSVPFIIYSNMIMFDLMLGVCALIGITATWDYAKTRDRKHLYLFMIAIGLGALAKGPAILLHTLFPIVLVRFWNRDGIAVSRKKWALGFLAAILGGTLIGLAWAIPAAIQGGPEFAHKIFIGQTAGRVTESFAHRHPVWWYVPFIPLLMMPWLLSPLLWRGFSRIKEIKTDDFVRFTGIWLIPVFLCFSLISGKQVHYLVPLLPGMALFFSFCVTRIAETFRTRDILPSFIAMLVLISIPLMCGLFSDAFGTRPGHIFSREMIAAVPLITMATITACFMLICITLMYINRKSLVACAMAVALSTLLSMVSFQIGARDGLFAKYDLTNVAGVIRKNPEAPLAYLRNYNGEWGYMARLPKDRNVEEVQIGHLPEWFRKHPDGMALIRTGHPAEVTNYDVIFSAPYKTSDTYYVVVDRKRAAAFQK